RRPVQLQVEPLEVRWMPAQFTYNAGTGLLTIKEFSPGENINIFETSGNITFQNTSSVTFSGTDQTGITGNGTTTLVVDVAAANVTGVSLLGNSTVSDGTQGITFNGGNFTPFSVQ